MNVQHLDPEKFFKAYNVDLQVIYPWEGVVEPPFGAVWAVLAPGEKTKLHQHQELETFIVARGEGILTIDGESSTVRPGSVTFQRPFQEHVLENTSASDDLLFMSVYWENRHYWPQIEGLEGERAAGAEVEADEDNGTENGIRRRMVTAAPPTPNGDLHLGHLSGPYLSADFYTRYLKLHGQEGYFACGTDDNCMYVERMGEQMGLSGQEAADHFYAAISETLAMAGVDLDVWIRPPEAPRFEPLARELFHTLRDKGEIEEREGPSPYCEACERYLFEADISGRCPHCGKGVTGNTCEPCGRINDAANQIDPRCTKCGQVPAARTFRRFIFPLSRWAERLTAYHQHTVMSPRLRAFCESAIADGLPDVAVSHPSTWGIPVPLDDAAFADQKIYIWFEMAVRYFAYAEEINEKSGVTADYGHFWRCDEAEIVQFYGFDNSFYYSLLLPAIYMAFDPDLHLPAAFVTNEFYRLDGAKFSTSRGHSILGRTLLAVAPRDVVRYYLAYSCPEREETNFTLEEFTVTVKRELIEGWQGWLGELGEKVGRELAGKVPATGDWTKDQLRFYRDLERFIADAAEAYQPATFSPQRLTRLLNELVRTARRFGKAEDHWAEVAERSQERRTALALEVLAAKVLALLAAPVMPEFTDRLWRDLGYTEPLGPGAWESTPEWVPADQELGALDREYFPDFENRLAEISGDVPSLAS